MKTIITEYKTGLGDFLDEKRIQWSYKDDLIKIYLPDEAICETQFAWDLAIEFVKYQVKLLIL